MEQNTNYDVIIIGSGPAGCSAGIYAARAGLKVLMLESMMPGSQVSQTAEVENYPAFQKIGGYELELKFSEHAASLGVKTVFGEVTAVELESKIKSITCGGNNYTAENVIIATGATRRTLGIPGEKSYTGRGVSYCAVCDGNFFKNKAVALVGGGNTALEDAIHLSRLCSRVYLIHRRDEFRASKILVNRMRVIDNITVLTPAVPLEISGESSVTALTVKLPESEKTLDVSGVFIAVGTIPATELFKNNTSLQFDSQGAIITDELCRTSIDGVYAAGDVRSKPLRQIITAAADGAIAGYDIGNK